MVRDIESSAKLRLLTTDLYASARLSLSDIARSAPSAMVITTANKATETRTSMSVNPRVRKVFISTSGCRLPVFVERANGYLTGRRYFNRPEVGGSVRLHLDVCG